MDARPWLRAARRRPPLAATALLAAATVAAGACDTGPATATDAPGAATTVDGRYTVTFELPHTSVGPDDPITGTATLRLTATGQRAIVSGSQAIFGFEFAEVGGEARSVSPVWDATCAPHAIGAEVPLTSAIVKSGAVDGGPQSAFVADFLKGTDVHLPAGDWDVSAIAVLYDAEGCRGPTHTIRATVRVHVHA